MKIFNLSPSDHDIWNKQELLEFLIANQGQSICLVLQHEGCDCASIGLYDLLDRFNFDSVTIETANPLETHNKYKCVASPFAFRFFDAHGVDHYRKFHSWNQRKIFGAFYNRPIWHRLGLFAHLYSSHRDQCLINFRSGAQSEDDRELFEIHRLFVHDPSAVQLLSNVWQDIPVTLESKDTYTKGATTIEHTDQLCEFYVDFFVDIVAETFVNGTTFFATEKTVRPMLLKKPFICMAARDHLEYLRQMGFKTFSNFWNEEYDGYSSIDRYSRILALIDTLSKYTKQDLTKMYSDMQPILNHNFDLLANGKFQTSIKLVV